ncbi:MAG: hypothetical protein ACTSPI_17580 [Candidatus Heimdallarchaeaceae archaeon]
MIVVSDGVILEEIEFKQLLDKIIQIKEILQKIEENQQKQIMGKCPSAQGE